MPMSEAADDIIMVEAGPSNDGAEVITGPEDLAFVEKPLAPAPAPLKRSVTNAKKQDGLMGGLFGSFRKSRRASETFDRPRSKPINEDDSANVRRKRNAVRDDDDAKRIRRDERKVRRSNKLEIDTEGFTTDAPPTGGASTEAEDVEAKREARRAKRLSEDQIAKEARAAEARESEERKARRLLSDKAQTEARKAKIREAREQKAREEEDGGTKRQDDNQARRSAPGDRYTQDETPRNLHGSPTEKRSRRREKDVQPLDPIGKLSSRPIKSEHRRSNMDRSLPPRTPDEEADRRARREERRTRHDRPSASRRKTAPAPTPVQDYFDPRNADRGPPLDSADPYLHRGANDHTSSWVNSQIVEPPPPPPIEPTVLDPLPDDGARATLDGPDDDLRRSRRKSSKRRSRYIDADADEEDGRARRRRERKERELKSSEGSEGDKYGRKKSDYGFSATPAVKTFDGRNALGAGAVKRGSWFKKIAGI